MQLKRLLIGVALLGAQLQVFAAESNAVYDSHCAMCHQKGGVGLAGQFPRLASRVGEFAATEGGRRYLIEVLLFGMAGKIDVDGAPIIGVMPPFAMLSDDDLASTLNYVIALERPGQSRSQKKLATVSAADIAKVRSAPALAPGQVHANRASVAAKQKN